MAKNLGKQLGINANTDTISGSTAGAGKPKNLGVSPIYNISGPSIHNSGGSKDIDDVNQTGVDDKTSTISR